VTVGNGKGSAMTGGRTSESSKSGFIAPHVQRALVEAMGVNVSRIGVLSNCNGLNGSKYFKYTPRG